MSDTIAEFLVAIGYDNDEAGANKVVKTVDNVDNALDKADKAEAKRRKERDKADRESNEARRKGLEEAQTQALAVTAAVSAAALGLVAAVSNVAKTYDHLYYTSVRTGASAQNIKGFQYAISQLGGTAEGALGSLENFAERLRSNPGLKSALNQLGVATTAGGKNRDQVDVLQDAIAAFEKKYPGDKYYVQKQLQELFGIDEKTAQAIMRDTAKFRAEYAKTLKDFGLNSQVAAENGKEFEQAMRSLTMTLTVMYEKLASDLSPAFTQFARDMTEWVKTHHVEIKNALVAIGDALTETAKAFRDIAVALKPVWEGFDALSKQLLGQSGLTTAFEAFGALLLLRVLAPLRLISLALAGIRAPAWLLGLLGVGGAASVAGAVALGAAATGHGYQTPEQAAANPEQAEVNKEANGRVAGIKKWVKDKLGIGGRQPPAHDARVRLGQGDRAEQGTSPVEPGPPGKYRPQYKLSDADLDQKVVNTIAGEVSTKNQAGVDAVINNMLNRVGSKGWGPSGNLLEVARAPGQYAGYRKASEEETKAVRDRIRAIASGGIPDNTNGSNSYRAGWYNGPWARKHGNGPVVGGNRYGIVPGIANGPFAAYPKPKEDEPPLPQAGADKVVREQGKAPRADNESPRPTAPSPNPKDDVAGGDRTTSGRLPDNGPTSGERPGKAGANPDPGGSTSLQAPKRDPRASTDKPSGSSQAALLNPDRMSAQKLFDAPPLAPAISNSSVFNLSQNNSITVNGANDPQATASEVQRRQNDVNGRFVRNVQGAVR